ncbi:MAG TPA: serine/threonine-protein kinase [Dokdonella sp.]|uniref:serine/threonine-protein kinase n=1 Tax=Dokdonella sp. TaxID=2291710 RepID=UPI002D7E2C7C|nr:serine/threonine-protein kinase [Dokdonella sp.]HET9032968.1 serine/threonine-protein kinase [Dokdonella sp.]
MTMRPESSEARTRALSRALDQVALIEGAERESWLQELARREPDLVRDLRRLIAGAEGLDALDDGPGLLAENLTETHGVLAPGSRLGAWRVVALLGRGGMGRVYLGERADGAFEKQVAIKVLRRERRLADAVIEHERALLARLEHPGLTRLLDGGISEDADAYLVMELVDGLALDAWCTQQQPDLDQRLDLFGQILDAIGHAHRQLVVHGDLKPDNLIIDHEQRVRVLDFGVARMLASDGADTLLAATPGWVAPECAAGAPANVASDIYNLGQLLNHLARSPAASIDDRIAHDLAAIIGRATRTDPDARYSSVGSLRDDLLSFRQSRPVEARAGGRGYRLRRFVKRHWIGVGFASLLFIVLVGAGSMVAWQDRIVRSERDTARLEATRSQIVLDYLLGILGQADNTAAGKPASLRSLLNDSLEHIDSDFSADPGARQALLAHLAEVLVRLNDFASAEKVLERFERDLSGSEPAQLRVRVLDNLAVVRMHQGRLHEARGFADQARQLLTTIAADQSGQMSELLVTDALIQARQGETSASIDTLRRALALRLKVSAANAAQTVVVRNSLAAALMRNGKMAEALQEYRQLDAALESSRREHSLDAATIYANYASTSFAHGDYQEARRMFERALALQEELYGPSAALAALLNNFGKLNLELGNLDAGRTQIQRAVAMIEQFSGSDSIDAQLIRLSLGQLALTVGDDALAHDSYRETGERLAAALGEDHPVLARARSGQLIAHARATGLSAEDPAFERMLGTLALDPSNRRPHAQLLCQRAELALAQQRLALARDSAAACLDLRRQHLAANSPPLLIAEYLEAEAAFRIAPSDASRQRRDAILHELGSQLGQDHFLVMRLAAL